MMSNDNVSWDGDRLEGFSNDGVGGCESADFQSTYEFYSVGSTLVNGVGVEGRS